MRKNATLVSFAEFGAELLWLSRQVSFGFKGVPRS